MARSHSADGGVNSKPAVAAITVGLSFFVGVMEIFVAIMAFAVAGRQGHPHAGVSLTWSNDTATRVAYGTGAISLLNSLLAFARARLNVVVTVFVTAVFIVTALFANILFVRAW
jgi:hypothetical protein